MVYWKLGWSVVGLFAGLWLPAIVAGQGCSDAGFCTLGSIRSLNVTQNNSKNFSLLGLGVSAGLGEKNTLIVNPAIEWSQVFSPKFAVHGRFTYQYASGNLGKVGGISDAFLSIIPTIYRKKDTDSTQHNLLITSTIGVRAPLGRTDFESGKLDSASLMPITYPMAYQPGLGSLDLIAGATLQIKSWHISVATQLPVYHVNRNNFIRLPDSLEKSDEKYFESRQLIRKPDVMLRLDKRFKAGEKLQLSAGLLALYHLGNDTSLDSIGKRFEHIDSQGISVNINLGILWLVGKHFRIEVQTGNPIIVRKNRPDGLTRIAVFTTALQYSF